MASPPASDGILPSSPALPAQYSSFLENRRPHRQVARNRRKAVLTPRKLARFFTPRSQGQPIELPGHRGVLEATSESTLNARLTPPPSSQDLPIFASSPCKSYSNPVRCHTSTPLSNRKRKRSTTRPMLDASDTCDMPFMSPHERSSGNDMAWLNESEQIDLVMADDDGNTRFPRKRSHILKQDTVQEESEPFVPSSPLGRMVEAGSPMSRRSVLNTDSIHEVRGPAEGRANSSRTSPETMANLTVLLQPQANNSVTTIIPAAHEQDATRPRVTLPDYFKSRRGGVRAISEEKPARKHPRPVNTIRKELELPEYKAKPVIKLRNRGFEAQLLLREQGMTPRPGRERIEYPAHDSRVEAANFHSIDNDMYMCSSEANTGNTIPFSLASCHNGALVAIGDEEGFIRFIDTSSATPDRPRNSPAVNFMMHAHHNAIMDLAFSNDDLRLATACGDCTGKIIDVISESVAVELNGGHSHSMRRVVFQPGQANGSVLATSDRDGLIQLWDIRCSSGPPVTFSTMGARNYIPRNPINHVSLPRPTNTMANAHFRTVEGETKGSSVTALHFMPAGREHLLLSACAGDSRIKVWDMRYITPRNKHEATPLAVAAEPTSHKWRPYGITSMALSTDASRLYAVCKDSVIYAYSTSHLMLGHAPELSAKPPRQRPGTAKPGLGPLYCFSDPELNVGSFYIRTALRTHRVGNGPELLAVGNSTPSPIIFPTDESNIREGWETTSHLPDMARKVPEDPASGPRRHDIPVVQNGVRLINGHRREVTGVNWTSEGKLVTIADDYSARVWQEGVHERNMSQNGQRAQSAKELRTCGDFGGRRWMAGWADWRRDSDDKRSDWDLSDDESPYA